MHAHLTESCKISTNFEAGGGGGFHIFLQWGPWTCFFGGGEWKYVQYPIKQNFFD